MSLAYNWSRRYNLTYATLSAIGTRGNLVITLQHLVSRIQVTWSDICLPLSFLSWQFVQATSVLLPVRKRWEAPRGGRLFGSSGILEELHRINQAIIRTVSKKLI